MSSFQGFYQTNQIATDDYNFLQKQKFCQDLSSLASPNQLQTKTLQNTQIQNFPMIYQSKQISEGCGQQILKNVEECSDHNKCHFSNTKMIKDTHSQAFINQTYPSLNQINLINNSESKQLKLDNNSSDFNLMRSSYNGDSSKPTHHQEIRGVDVGSLDEDKILFPFDFAAYTLKLESKIPWKEIYQSRQFVELSVPSRASQASDHIESHQPSLVKDEQRVVNKFLNQNTYQNEQNQKIVKLPSLSQIRNENAQILSSRVLNLNNQKSKTISQDSLKDSKFLQTEQQNFISEQQNQHKSTISLNDQTPKFPKIQNIIENIQSKQNFNEHEIKLGTQNHQQDSKFRDINNFTNKGFEASKNNYLEYNNISYLQEEIKLKQSAQLQEDQQQVGKLNEFLSNIFDQNSQINSESINSRKRQRRDARFTNISGDVGVGYKTLNNDEESKLSDNEEESSSEQNQSNNLAPGNLNHQDYNLDELQTHLRLIETLYQVNDESNEQVLISREKIKSIITNRCLKHLNRELRRLGMNVGNKCLYWVYKIGMRRNDWVIERRKWQQDCILCSNKINQEQKTNILKSEFQTNPYWSSHKIKELANRLQLKVNQVYKWKWDNLEKLNKRKEKEKEKEKERNQKGYQKKLNLPSLFQQNSHQDAIFSVNRTQFESLPYNIQYNNMFEESQQNLFNNNQLNQEYCKGNANSMNQQIARDVNLKFPNFYNQQNTEGFFFQNQQ